MQYLKFRVSDYRAITEPLEIDLEGNSLIPIIGINESGKTTILHAIFAFDAHNDNLLHGGQHLKDMENLYELRSGIPTVAAQVSISAEEYKEALNSLTNEGLEVVEGESDARIEPYWKICNDLPDRIWITRNLESKQYLLDGELFPDSQLNHDLAFAIVQRLPYILFFDDFRDSIDELVPIVRDANGNATGWLAILERLFRKTNPSLSVFDLAGMDERKRNGTISDAVVRLNETLTSEWVRFGLDEDEDLEESSPPQSNLRLDISFESPVDAASDSMGALKLQVVERTAAGRDRFFYLLNRSKGFYWFCNFVMKLEFNPKTLSDDHSGAVYLLDEPGAYLHTSAQSRLCEKLSGLAEDNVVIYCTHSQYLLNPAVIPLSTIQIANKDGSGRIHLKPYHEYPATGIANKWAHQPILDALRIKPFVTDLNYRRILIVEGITDAYAFEMMTSDTSLGFMAATGAGSIQELVSLLLGWSVDFTVMWDNDKKGRQELGRARKFFGDRMAQRRFSLLPMSRGQRKRVLEDLFEESDKELIRQRVGFKPRASFKKALEALYYAPDREAVLGDVSAQTKANFAHVVSALPIGGVVENLS